MTKQSNFTITPNIQFLLVGNFHSHHATATAETQQSSKGEKASSFSTATEQTKKIYCSLSCPHYLIAKIRLEKFIEMSFLYSFPFRYKNRILNFQLHIFHWLWLIGDLLASIPSCDRCRYFLCYWTNLDYGSGSKCLQSAESKYRTNMENIASPFIRILPLGLCTMIFFSSFCAFT